LTVYDLSAKILLN